MNIFISVALFVIGLVYRLVGLKNNYPFWVDEFSSGKTARYFLEYGLSAFMQPGIVVERHNITTHLLIALSFKIFGEHEWAARLPFAVIGSLLPVIVYLLVKKIFNKTVGICAAVLCVHSYFLITWSRQAREYALLGVLSFATLYSYYFLIERKRSNNIPLLLFVSLIILGVLTHPMYYFLIGAIGIHAVLRNSVTIVGYLKKRFVQIAVTLLSFMLICILYVQDVFRFFTTTLFGANNLWYYHSFLWREYPLITFLGLAGLMVGLIKKREFFSILLIHMGFHLVFITFMFGHYNSKYLLPIFPYFLIGTAIIIAEVTELIAKKYFSKDLVKVTVLFVPILIVLVIVANGHKFIIKPKQYYSVNKDFREIANIDYHQVYNIIKDKGDLSKGETAVIDTWPDRTKWYLGNSFPGLFFFKWQNEQGRVSGHIKQTPYEYTPEGGKITQGPGERFNYIGELKDLQFVMKKYPRGFLFIDDATLQKEIIDYAEKNLTKEIYLDHYPLDENPYSLWPATLYSWDTNEL